MHDREIDEVHATRKPVRGELPVEGPGGLRHYDYIFVPVIGADGEVEAVAGTARDVTERKETERRLREGRDQLDSALAAADDLVDQLRHHDRRKDEFLATLAHELRNPLAPICNALQLMRMAGMNGALEQARAMLERQLAQLIRLVDDLLDVSRVTNGKRRLALRKAHPDPGTS